MKKIPHYVIETCDVGNMHTACGLIPVAELSLYLASVIKHGVIVSVLQIVTLEHIERSASLYSK